jgi:hypothetical protein
VTVLAATNDGLYVVDDDGRAERVLPGNVGAIATAPDGAWWAIVDEHDLVRTGAGHEPEAVDRSGEHMTCVVATANDVFVGTVGAHLLHLVDGTLARVESFEELEGREGWGQPWGAPGDARSFAADGDHTVYANVHVGGVLRTHDGGESWVQTIDPAVDVHEVALAPDGRLFAATGASGLARSDDGGSTWSFETDGLHGTYLRSVAATASGVVVSASHGPFADESAIYRRREGTRQFEHCTEGIPARFPGNVDTFALATAGDRVVCAGTDGAVYRSDDAGGSWRTLAKDLPEVRAVLVVP